MKLHIDIELGNDAMQTGYQVINAIMSSRVAAEDPTPMQVGERGKIRDANGNTVGEWKVE
jgi:hypothetical protein